MAKARSKKVVKTKTAAVTGPSSIQQAMMRAAGAGNEGVTQRDLAIPFIRLLQDLSPQTKKRDEQYIDGAVAGMFYDSVSQSVWDGDEGVLMIPCYYSFMVNEWVKRSAGGGFVASHPDMGAAIANCADADNHDLVDTHQHAVLVRHPDGSWKEAIFPLKSTGIKASRQWNSLVTGQTGSYVDDAGKEQTYELPRFFAIWRLKTAEKSNDKGNFFVPKTPEHEINLEELGNEGEALFQKAFAFYKQCDAGEASIDYRRMEDEVPEAEDPSAPGF